MAKSHKKEPEKDSATLANLELDKLKVESSDYKDKYLRLLADTENARKRLQKERQEIVFNCLQSIFVELLSPIDHLDNALKFTEQMTEETKQWAVGFKMILAQFKDVLATNNVHEFHAEGKEFDPHLHEAIEMVESEDHQPGMIVRETLKGYKMGDKVLRPARVTVAKELKKKE